VGDLCWRWGVMEGDGFAKGLFLGFSTGAATIPPPRPHALAFQMITRSHGRESLDAVLGDLQSCRHRRMDGDFSIRWAAWLVHSALALHLSCFLVLRHASPSRNRTFNDLRVSFFWRSQRRAAAKRMGETNHRGRSTDRVREGGDFGGVGRG